MVRPVTPNQVNGGSAFRWSAVGGIPGGGVLSGGGLEVVFDRKAGREREDWLENGKNLQYGRSLSLALVFIKKGAGDC